MLRHFLEDDIFFEALRTYYSDLIYKSVSTEDFKNVCERISGKQLDTFFDQWINHPFFPRYLYTWEQLGTDSEKIKISLTILQEQQSLVYEMPVDIQVNFPSGHDTLIQVINNQKDQTYTFEFSEIPQSVILDPDNWILKEVRNQTGGTYTPKISIENIYPNPTKFETNIIVKFWGQGNLDLKVFNNLGQVICTLKPYFVSSIHKYYYKWDGKDRFGKSVSAGNYFVTAVTDKKISANASKIVIIK